MFLAKLEDPVRCSDFGHDVYGSVCSSTDEYCPQGLRMEYRTALGTVTEMVGNRLELTGWVEVRAVLPYTENVSRVVDGEEYTHQIHQEHVVSDWSSKVSGRDLSPLRLFVEEIRFQCGEDTLGDACAHTLIERTR
jgi:hypothetical protein